MAVGRNVDGIGSLPVPALELVDGVVTAMNARAERLLDRASVGCTFDDCFDGGADGAVVAVGRDRWATVFRGEPDTEGREVVLLVDATDRQFTMRALDAVAGSTFVLDGAGRPRWRSDQLRRRSALDDRAAAQQNPSERIHPEDLPRVLDTFVDAAPGKPSRVVVRSRSVDDDDRWETIEVVVHHRLDDEVLRGYLVQVHNLDDGVHLDAGIGGDDGEFLSLTEAAPVGIAATDTAGEIVYRNRVARELLGADIESLGRESRWLALARAEHRPALRDVFDAALRRAQPSMTTAAFPDGEGGERWLRIATTPQHSASGRPRGLIATIEDVTEQRRAQLELDDAQAKLRHLADHDHLTGLPNRATLTARLDDALARHPTTGAGLALLFCDLDGFKPINDRHGHVAGDAVLVEVAGRLRTAVEHEAVLARMGGDEFVVLCEGATAEDRLLALAERIHSELRPPFDVDGDDATLAVSIGIASLPLDATSTSERLLRIADQAMYEAKASGTERTVLRTVDSER